MTDENCPSFKLNSILRKEICKSSRDEFLKNLIISPDGSYYLTSSESNFLAIWKLEKSYDINEPTVQNNLTLNLAISVGESIYDSCWYPHMTADEPASSCFLSSSRDHPIHLWDSNSGNSHTYLTRLIQLMNNSVGHIRCSYLGINHLDELESAISVSFNLLGDKIYAGSNKKIRSPKFT